MTEKEDRRDIAPVHNRLPRRLSPQEVATKKRAEKSIEKGFQAFYEMGQALKVIRAQRLYRESHATFTDYCLERWGFDPSRARQLISAADVASDLESYEVRPVNEHQIRPLVPLDRNLRRLVWERAIQQAPQPSEGIIRQALSEVIRNENGEPETVIEEAIIEKTPVEPQQAVPLTPEQEARPEPAAVRRDVYGRTLPEPELPAIEPEVPTLRSLCETLEDRIERVLDFLPRENGTPDPDLGEALVELDTIIHQLVPQLRHQTHVENHVAH